MTTKRKNSDNKNLMIIGGVVSAAIVVAIIVIVISGQSTLGTSSVDYSKIPQGRQADGGFVLGDPNAPITIVAFEDFLCPHCQRYEPTVDAFIENYVAKGLARFEYRMLPAVDATYSPLAAKFVECAGELKEGAFWPAHDLMFELASSSRFNNSTPRTFADRIGIPYADLLECTSDADQVNVDTALANTVGASGTPTVMVRYGDELPQYSQFGQQPTLEQLGLIVASAQ